MEPPMELHMEPPWSSSQERRGLCLQGHSIQVSPGPLPPTDSNALTITTAVRWGLPFAAAPKGIMWPHWGGLAPFQPLRTTLRLPAHTT